MNWYSVPTFDGFAGDKNASWESYLQQLENWNVSSGVLSVVQCHRVRATLPPDLRPKLKHTDNWRSFLRTLRMVCENQYSGGKKRNLGGANWAVLTAMELAM